ncbi:MAG: threonine synthase [Elusimicrobia bacterium HGW-Elusimicrobia-4]|nr:MAG: threonine synthase [Elusimicrobia bacterium HGW-Elusimicrobia-4]
MKNILGLKCIVCGKEFSEKDVKYVCLSCGGNLDVVYNYAEIKKKFTRSTLTTDENLSIWRYLPILPLESDFSCQLNFFPKLHIGWTPLYRAENLSRKYNFPNLYLKDDGRNPSASFKDRASSVVVVKGQELGVKTFTTASTGNAGCALACMCANLQLPCVIFVPKTAPKAKIAQLLLFGAKVIAVHGTYDDAFDLSLKASDEFGWYCRSTGYNPYTREGKKTAAYEICEQLKWKVPDKVFVSVGDGNIISGTWKGFKDFYALGFIDKLPQLIAVQSEKSNAISQAYKNVVAGLVPAKKIKIQSVKATTIADSISVDMPRDGVAAVKAVIESKGFAIEVSDDEILNAIKEIAENEGVFSEPAASTSFAGFKKALKENKIKENETVICLITGNGLKDVESAMKVAGVPVLIEPNIEEVKKIIKNA